MRRLGYWLIGLIILSIVSNFFLPFVGFISIFSGILTIAMWLVYYGYISLGVLMAGKLILERQQEKESGLETKGETKKLFGKGKHSQPAIRKAGKAVHTEGGGKFGTAIIRYPRMLWADIKTNNRW